MAQRGGSSCGTALLSQPETQKGPFPLLYLGTGSSARNSSHSILSNSLPFLCHVAYAEDMIKWCEINVLGVLNWFDLNNSGKARASRNNAGTAAPPLTKSVCHTAIYCSSLLYVFISTACLESLAPTQPRHKIEQFDRVSDPDLIQFEKIGQ